MGMKKKNIILFFLVFILVGCSTISQKRPSAALSQDAKTAKAVLGEFPVGPQTTPEEQQKWWRQLAYRAFLVMVGGLLLKNLVFTKDQ